MSRRRKVAKRNNEKQTVSQSDIDKQIDKNERENELKVMNVEQKSDVSRKQKRISVSRISSLTYCFLQLQQKTMVARMTYRM